MNTTSLNQRGFTLVELMVTIAVIAVVLAIGVPGIAQLKRNNEITTATKGLSAALNFARAEAVRRGDDVMINPRSGDWAKGWTVNSSEAGNPVLRAFDAPPPSSTITASLSPVTFEALGNASAAACFDVSIAGNSSVRSIPISPAGRISTCRATCAAVTADPTICY